MDKLHDDAAGAGADGVDDVLEAGGAPIGSSTDEAKTGEETQEDCRFATGELMEIPISQIDVDDTTFRFRKDLRVGSLKRSIENEGLQIPLVLRRLPSGRYQIVSGFRRITAVIDLGWESVPAFVRDDLDEVEAALGAAVLENLYRKTLNDIDRALVVKAYRDRGKTADAVGTIMNLSRKQVGNVRSLLELPTAAQHAIGDAHLHFSATHGLALRKIALQHPEVEWEPWIAMCNAHKMTVAEFERAVRKTLSDSTVRKPFVSVFNPSGTDLDQSVVRFSSAKLDLAQLSTEELRAFVAELEMLRKAVDSMLEGATAGV